MHIFPEIYSLTQYFFLKKNDPSCLRPDCCPQCGFARMWIHACYATQKNILPVLVIDEAQNLPNEFLRDFPSFLNFVMDSKDYVTVWLVGHPEFEKMIDRVCYTALSSRIQARCRLTPIEDRDAFRALLTHGFESAGAQGTLLSDTGIEILRMASRGNPRQLHRIVVSAMQIAAEKKQNHLPDDVIKEAISGLRMG